jgi:DEAD/DEAH box helicase domain-containing protein
MTTSIDALVRAWRRGEGHGAHMTAIERTPARPARFAHAPRALDGRVTRALARRGVSQLYTHQADAVGRAISGQDVVVVTPTASGKSLCYNLPVLHALGRGGAALYLFPTKALGQDQRASLDALLADTPGLEGVRARVYDGDTPKDERRAIRDDPRLVVSTPDMLHGAILPHHAAWRRLFTRLEVVVLDELHTYRGLFGAHVANVLRRLRRVCAHHGADPVFVATSATIDNPQELANTLTGRRFHLVGENGAPSAQRTLCFYNPPVVEPGSMRRRSARACAAEIAGDLIGAKLPTIVFARSRQSVELLTGQLEQRLGKRGARRVASYRGGYLPELRRDIEKRMRQGKLDGIVSTNALELGVDVGDLDACVLAGYPGSIASAWQQIGRAGRRHGDALAVLVASPDPLDQYVVHHPEYFLGRAPERARLDPDNLRVVTDHMRCAAYELPVSGGFGGFGATDTHAVFTHMARRHPALTRKPSGWSWPRDDGYPAADVGLRAISGPSWDIVDAGKDRVIGTLDHASALTTLFPGAVHRSNGVSWTIEAVDHDARRALARRDSGDRRTVTVRHATVAPLLVHAEGMRRMASVGFGEVRVTERALGYKSMDTRTGEEVASGALDLPAHTLDTMAYWLTLPSHHFASIGADRHEWLHLIYGLGRVLETVAALLLMCDPRDVHLIVGSPRLGMWLTSGPRGLTLRAKAPDDPHDQRPAVLRNPTLFLHDRFPGGVGLGEGLHEQHDAFMRRAYELLETCPCARGCPSCIGPQPGEAAIKAKALRLLGHLAPR